MRKALWAVLVGSLLGLGLGYHLGAAQGRKSLTLMLKLFQQVISYTRQYYVEEINPADLVQEGIEGMVHALDPYSDFLTPEENKQWKVRTEGEFGGIGIQIGMRDGWLTVIAPIEGTPAYRAGLRSGDRIIRIEGESTRGITLEDAVKKLRGKPGTQVTITIARPGVEEPFDVTITRAIIKIKAVPFYTLLDGDIGYIRMVSFNRHAAEEVKAALDSLFARGAKRIILDLKNNPGGLLSQAVAVANLFLPKGSLVVYTKGRIPEANKEFYAKEDPPHGTDFPMAVLINKGSASASEIVSGALQDWDRAILIGDTTFGKGSVQRIFRLYTLEGPEGPEEYAVKLTTAKYYTPAGRSIHRESRRSKLVAFEPDTFPYQTRVLHRLVYGGGGIAPDVFVEEPDFHPLVSKGLAKNAFFSFAVQYVQDHPQPPASPHDIRLTKRDLEAFKAHMREKGVEFRDSEFEEARDDLAFFLKLDIAEKYWGMKGRYEVLIEHDPTVKRAMELLKGTEDVAALLQSLTEAEE